MLFQVVFGFCLLGILSAAREADRVTDLPGLKETTNLRHYAGYLDATNGNKLFYWFVESENSPLTDPLMVWFDGIPMCSTVVAMLSEIGPWRLNSDGTALHLFEHRWNKITNILFIDSPVGTGYSYNKNCDYTSNNDTTIVSDIHVALLDFYSGFPEYADNDLYLTGQGYASIYAFTLADRFLDETGINFKGIAIGNPSTNSRMTKNSYIYYVWARGMFSPELGDDLSEHCCVNRNISDCDFTPSDWGPCKVAVLLVTNKLAFGGLNPYNLYGVCPSPELSKTMHHYDVSDGNRYLQKINAESMKTVDNNGSKCSVRDTSFVCTNTAPFEKYMRNPDTRKALHVPDNVQEWGFCREWQLNYDYRNQNGTIDDSLLNRVLDAGKRVMIYYGDASGYYNALGGLWFVESLRRNQTLNYHYWGRYNDYWNRRQVEGFSITYDNLIYVTLKGAGYYASTDKPSAAFEMWRRFLADEPFGQTEH